MKSLEKVHNGSTFWGKKEIKKDINNRGIKSAQSKI